MSCIQEFQASLDQGQGKLRATSDQAHKVLPNTAQPGCDAIKQQLKTFQQDYDALATQATDTRGNLESLLNSWNSFNRSLDQVSTWLKETEVRSKSDSGLKSDLAEKKAHLEKFKAR